MLIGGLDDLDCALGFGDVAKRFVFPRDLDIASLLDGEGDTRCARCRNEKWRMVEEGLTKSLASASESPRLMTAPQAASNVSFPFPEVLDLG